MHRRKFLGTVILGAGATALPVWLSRAFRLGEATCPEPIDLSGLPVQITDPDTCLPGSASGPLKPQLVFVIPTDSEAQFLRGHAFGELLNHGSDEQLAPLACFDVVCRRLSDLAPIRRADPAHEPLMIVIDRDTGTMTALDATLPTVERASSRYERNDEAENKLIDARITLLASLVADAADGARLSDQACRERASLAPGDLRRLDELPGSLGELQPADVDRAPATTIVLARTADREGREHLTALLAAAVRARLCDQRIDGAPWARATGCGVEVEGEEPRGGFACGMGSTPERSKRFLKFYVSNH